MEDADTTDEVSGPIITCIETGENHPAACGGVVFANPGAGTQHYTVTTGSATPCIGGPAVTLDNLASTALPAIGGTLSVPEIAPPADFLDNFAGVDASSLIAHTSDSGNHWLATLDPIAGGDGQLVTGRGTVRGDADGALYAHVVTDWVPPGTDYTVEWDVFNVDDLSGAIVSGRDNGLAGGAAYQVYMEYDGPVGRFSMIERIGAAFNSLGHIPISVPLGTSVHCTMVFSGSNVAFTAGLGASGPIALGGAVIAGTIGILYPEATLPQPAQVSVLTLAAHA